MATHRVLMMVKIDEYPDETLDVSLEYEASLRSIVGSDFMSRMMAALLKELTQRNTAELEG